MEKWESLKLPIQEILNQDSKHANKIAQIFFEQDESELNLFLDTVSSKIEQNYQDTGEKKILYTYYLMLLLDEFHASK